MTPSSEQQPNDRKLTAEACCRVADALRDGAKRLDLSLPAGSTIAEMIRDAQWLGSGPADVFGSGCLFDADPDRFARAFMRIEQAERLARMLHSAQWVTGFEQQQMGNWLRKRLDRLESQTDQSLDHVFELEIAGRLARWPALKITLAEPDIQIHMPGMSAPMVLACKRPRGTANLLELVVKAAKQIESSGHLGFIVVGAEALFHHEATLPKPKVFHLRSRDDATRQGGQILDDVLKGIRANTKRVWRPGVGGVYLCGLLTFWCMNPSGYLYTWIRRSEANQAVAYSEETLKLLDDFLFAPIEVPTSAV